MCALYYRSGLLASAGADNTVRLTDVAQGRFERLLPGTSTTALKFDDHSLIAADFIGEILLYNID